MSIDGSGAHRGTSPGYCEFDRISADEVLIQAARVKVEWDALRSKMTREPFMPRSTREALDALSTAVAKLRKVRP